MRFRTWSSVFAALSVAGLASGCSADGSSSPSSSSEETKSCSNALRVPLRGGAAEHGPWSPAEATTVSLPASVAWHGDALPPGTTATLRLTRSDGTAVACVYEGEGRSLKRGKCDAPEEAVQRVASAQLELSAALDGEITACLGAVEPAPDQAVTVGTLPRDTVATPPALHQDALAPAPRSGVKLPGVEQAEAPRVGTAEAERIIAAKPNLDAVRAREILALNEAQGAATLPEVIDQARALRNDVDRIFEYVYDEITYTPSWGLKKGPASVMQDKAGNAFDQANLMVQLLRAAGYTADLVMGKIKLTGDQTEAWFGSRKFDVIAYLLPSGGIPGDPITIDASRNVVTLPISHVWVRATGKDLGASVFHFDPSRKTTTAVAPTVSLATAMAYDRAAFLTAAGGAGGDIAGSLRGFNGTALKNNLHTYATNLANNILSSHRFESLDQVLGGRVITRIAGAADLRQADNPVRDTAVAPTIWTGEVPDAYRTTLRLRVGGIDNTQFADMLSGKRLTVRYGADLKAVLALDGATLATATTAGTAGQSQAMTVDINEPYAANSGTYIDQSGNISLAVGAGNTFAVMNGWGVTGRASVELHRKRARDLRAAGSAADSEAVLGESLQALADLWLSERSLQTALAERITPSYVIPHHMVGVAGQTQAPYVDIPFGSVSTISKVSGTDSTAFFNGGGFGSAFESTVIEQSQAVEGISTISLFDVANTLGNTFYEATSANWASVRPKLATLGFDANELAWADSYVNGGWRLIVPGNGDVGKGTWKGFTFLGVTPDQKSITYIINGAKGGYSGSPVTAGTAATSITSTSPPAFIDGGLSSTGLKSGDPVAVASGDFVHKVEDLSVGPEGARLVFSRGYNSGAYARPGLLGRGWGHGFDTHVGVDSDGYQAMGEDSAADAAAMVAALYVSYDLLSVDKSLKTLVLSSLVQQWGTKNLIDNAATVATPGAGGSSEFIKVPNGLNAGAPVYRWLAPPGSASKLDKPANFRLTTKNQVVTSFNADGTIASVLDPNGVGSTYQYTTGALSSVTHTNGWKLSFTYEAGRVKTVTDGARTVTYTYDAAGNLAKVTDPRLKDTTYSYASAGRMTSMFYPAAPTTAFFTNTYDSYGRVKTQSNAIGGVTQYFVSGYRSEEIDPASQSKVWFFERGGLPFRSVDPVGRVTLTTYDGQRGISEVRSPEGNRVQYKYDGRYNVIETRHKAKDASADLVTTSVYDATWNKPTSVKDALLHETKFEYDAKGNLFRRTDPVVDAVAPVTTWTLNARGQIDTVTDPTSRVTKYTYDEAGKKALLTVQLDPTGLNVTTTYGYDAAGNVTSVKDARGNTTTYVFSPTRKVTQETKPVPETGGVAPVTKWTYDANDRVDEVQQILGTSTFRQKTTYTPTSLVATVSSLSPLVDAATPKTVNAYDAALRLSTVTDREGRVTKYEYFADGQPKVETRAFGTTDAAAYATYTYTPNGKVKTLADANGNLTTYQYDAYDRLVKTLYPSKTAAGTSDAADFEQVGYDATGNVLTKRTRANQTFTFTYDALNRQRTRSGGGAPNVAFDLDGAGRTTKVRFADGSQVITSAYDAAGRATDVTDVVGTWTRSVKRTLDKQGNLTRIDWPDGYFVTYEYDADNRLRFVKESGTTLLATYTYDAMSRRSTFVRGGVTTSYVYSGSGPQTGRLYQITHDAAGTADDVTLTYGYNKEGQVNGVWSSNAAYVYVPGANTTVASTANGQNQLATVATVAQTYDANGNATNPEGLALTHDGLNRLTAASKTGLAAAYGFDPTGRRVKKTVNSVVSQSLQVGLSELGDYDGANALVRRYIPGVRADEVVAIVEGGVKRYPLHDRLGSVIGVANASGTVTAKYTYDPFGKSAAAACQASAAGCNKARFAGRTLDAETGFYDMRARAYSASLGRFLQTDPLKAKDDVNLYAYAHGDPATLVDPLGTEAQQPSSSPSFWDRATSRLVGSTAGMGYSYPTFSRGPDVGYNATVNIGFHGRSVEAAFDIDTNRQTVYETEYNTEGGVDVGFSPFMANLVFSHVPGATAQDVVAGSSNYVTGLGFAVFWNDTGWGIGTAEGGAGFSFSHGSLYSRVCTSWTECEDSH